MFHCICASSIMLLKAFDCVSHSQLWNTMTEMGFPKHLVALMAKLYEDQQSSVRTSVGDTEWFSIERGVRQGCILSPYLFNIYSERIMRDVKAEFEGGVQIGGERQNNLRFADDTVLLCNSKEELVTDMIQLVRDKSAERGLLLNVKKTKILVVDSNREDTSAFNTPFTNSIMRIISALFGCKIETGPE